MTETEMKWEGAILAERKGKGNLKVGDQWLFGNIKLKMGEYESGSESVSLCKLILFSFDLIKIISEVNLLK